MRSFVQHGFKTKMHNAPILLVSRRAFDAMFHFVDLSPEEVSWLGTVEELKKNVFLIDEVYLVEQEVEAATTEMDPAGLANLGTELLRQPGGVEKFNKLRFWGHSHVNFGTGPSAQDQQQLESFHTSGHPYMIRGILNKKGRMEFSILFYESGIQIDDVPWQLSTAADHTLRDRIAKELKRKVKSRTHRIMLESSGGRYQLDERTGSVIISGGRLVGKIKA